MSEGLESLLDPERRAQCEANDALLACCTHRCYEGTTCPKRYGYPTARRHPRSLADAFPDVRKQSFEPHIAPSFWQRVRLFFRRRLA